MAATGIDGGLDGGNATGGGGADPPDTVPPTITIISPTPGVAPGAPGGFSADWQIARMTPVVARVADLAPGNRYQAIVLRYAGTVDEITVYRRGAFRGGFVGPSTVTAINATTLEFSFRPATGWPPLAASVTFSLELDALDGAGNLAT
jgi:hypothetical protein